MPRKTQTIKSLFAVALIFILLMTSGCSLFKKRTAQTIIPNGSPSTGDISSKVSLGVNLNDLGNIFNGQYYFDDGTDRYYSSFDTNNAAHIYKMDKSGKSVPIFDGFGWSLVTNGDWLYFSGNQGLIIDGTYNLFRVKKDGSTLEHLNTSYCYGMSFYDEWIYYYKRGGSTAVDSICRSNLDGSNEQVITTDTKSVSAIYENMIYYTSKTGFLYKSNPDGTNPVKLMEDSIYTSVIGNGKLIYVDATQNIYTADINGSNRKLVRAAGGDNITSINSYKGTIFFAQTGSVAAEGRYAYPYTLSRIDFDGSNNKKIYDGISYGTYVNVVNEKVYVMDYAIDVATGKMPAIAYSMDLNGGGLANLFR